MSKIVKNTIIYTIGNSLPMGITLLLLPIYTSYMSPSEYGIVGAMDAAKIFFTILFSLCIERGIVRLYFDYNTESEKKKFLGVVFVLISIVSVTFLLLAFIFRNQIQLIFKNIPFYPYFSYTIGIAFLLTFEHLPKLYYRLKEKALSFVSLSLIYMILTTSLIIWFVVFKQEGALGYLKGQFISSAIMLILYLIISFKISTLNFDSKIIKNLLQFTIPFIPPLFISWFLTQSNRVFLDQLVSLDSVGIFSFSTKIAMTTSIFTTALMISFEPNFYKLANLGEKGKNKISSFFSFFMFTAIFSSFIIAFLAKELLIIFFNSEYSESYDVIAIVILANVLSTFGAITSLFFQQSKKMVANMNIAIVVAILSFILNYFFITYFYEYGAAFSLFFVSLFAFVSAYIYARRYCYSVNLPIYSTFLTMFLLVSIYVLLNDLFGGLGLIYIILIKSLVILLIGIVFFIKFKKNIHSFLNFASKK